MLTTQYRLPFRLVYQNELASPGHDILLRLHLDNTPTQDAADTFNASVLPLMLAMTTGAFAGNAIAPWTSTVRNWGEPTIDGNVVQWTLEAVNCDLRAWIVLAQHFIEDAANYPVNKMEVLDAHQVFGLVGAVSSSLGANPYPARWSGIDFLVDFDADLSKFFTVRVVFAHEPSPEEQEMIVEDLYGWAPALMNGFYAVAPLSRDDCIGIPDEDIAFIGNELEWTIGSFRADPAAIDGLMNVFMSISRKIDPVLEFHVE